MFPFFKSGLCYWHFSIWSRCRCRSLLLGTFLISSLVSSLFSVSLLPLLLFRTACAALTMSENEKSAIYKRCSWTEAEAEEKCPRNVLNVRRISVVRGKARRQEPKKQHLIVPRVLAAGPEGVASGVAAGGWGTVWVLQRQLRYLNVT